MSIQDFDAIIIKRKNNAKKKKVRAGLNDLDKEMKDMGDLSQNVQQVEKTGNNITLHLKINLANQTVLPLNVPDTTKVQELIDMIRAHLQISLNIFFLCEMKEGSEQVTKFYNNQKTLFQEKINDATILGYRIQWLCKFNDDNVKNLPDNDITYLFHCLRRMMIDEPFPIERKVAQALGGLLVQYDLGKYEEDEINTLDIYKYCNKLVVDNYKEQNMRRSIVQLHDKLKNQTEKIRLMKNFILMSQRCVAFGATLFEAFVSGKKVKVAVVPDGIIEYLSDVIEDITFYSIQDMKQIYTANDVCVIYFRNNKFKQVKTARTDKMTQLLSGYYYLANQPQTEEVEKPASLQYFLKDDIFKFDDLRKEVALLTDRLKYFHEILQVSAQDAGLENPTVKRFHEMIRFSIQNGQNLSSFNLAATNISIDQFGCLAESFERTFKSRGGKDVKETLNVQEITLADNDALGADMQFAPYLTLILRSPVALKRIDLRNIGLNDETAKVLVDGFKACNSLEYLSLGNNKNLTSNLVQMILKSISRGALGRLDIRGIKTTPQDSRALIRVISGFTNLNTLIMKNMDIGAGGNELGNLVKSCKKLATLDVRHCGMSKDVVMIILKGLADNRVLRDLRLTGNSGMSDVISYLVDITEEGKKVKFPPVARLDIGGDSLTSSDLKRLLKLLQRPQVHITALDISGADLKSDISKLFETFLSMEKNGSCIQQLNVNDTKISDTVAHVMVEYLTKTTKLTKFKCGYNPTLFRKGDYSCISEMIRGNKTLKNLHISDLNLPPEQIDPIFDAIVNHPSLVKLTFDGNPCGSYMDKIAQLLASCPNLKGLRLRRLEAITKDEMSDWLNNYLPDVMGVETIHVSGNKLVTSDLAVATDKHFGVHFKF